MVESEDPEFLGSPRPPKPTITRKFPMLLTTLCANAPAIHADVYARPRVGAHVETFTFAMPSTDSLNKGNLTDGAGLRGVRSSG